MKDMIAAEAYEAIRRTGYRHGITVTTRQELEPDRIHVFSASIATYDGFFTGVDIADACAKVIASLKRAERIELADLIARYSHKAPGLHVL